MKDEIYFGPKMPWGEKAYFVNVDFELVKSGHEWDPGVLSPEFYSLEMFETDPEKPELLYNLNTIPDHYLDQIREDICRRI